MELISQLNAFAEYTDTLTDEDDGALIGLSADASQARAHLERALEALAVKEGLIAAPTGQG